jgi:hypothetical protein
MVPTVYSIVHALLFQHGLGGAVGQVAQVLHLLALGDQRVHDLGDRRGLAGLGDVAGGLDDRPDLHLVDLGIRDAQAAAAVAEHGVGLVQFLGPLHQLLGVQAGGLGHGHDVFFRVRQELVQRRVEQADGDRQAFHDREQLDEVGLLEGRDLGQGRAAAGLVVGQDHLAHGGDPGVVEEHVLGAAQADALGAELAGGLGVQRGLGVGADLHAAHRVGPFHQGGEVAGQLGLDHLGRADQDLAGRAVDGDDLAGLELAAAHPEQGFLGEDRHVAGARDAGPAHAARHDGGVAGHAAPGGDDAARGVHAVDVLGRGLFAHQDHGLAGGGGLFGGVAVEDDLAGGRAGRGRQALGDQSRWAVGSMVGCSSWSSEAGSTRPMASSRRSRPRRPCRRRSSGRPWPCACRCGSAACRACPARP